MRVFIIMENDDVCDALTSETVALGEKMQLELDNPQNVYAIVEEEFAEG